jgi:hypothetical protein
MLHELCGCPADLDYPPTRWPVSISVIASRIGPAARPVPEPGNRVDARFMPGGSSWRRDVPVDSGALLRNHLDPAQRPGQRSR